MEPSVIRITQKDNYQIRLFCYKTASKEVLGSVIVLHGVAEHHGRYSAFIQELTVQGYDVYTYDHRGHGIDKKFSELGFVAKKGGDALLVEDALTVCRYVKEYGRNPKLAIFGHSMGSLILRCLLQQYDDFNCAVISSSTMPSAIYTFAGYALSGLCCLFQGAKKHSPFLNKKMFGGKAYSSLCSRTAYDWLTRNNTLIGQYIHDPYCGFVLTTSLYHDLTLLCKKAANKKRIAKTRKDFPQLILTGSKDPVGGYSSQMIKLKKLYDKLGFTNTSLIVYPEARHELLNELMVDDVYQDIFEFLRSNLQ